MFRENVGRLFIIAAGGGCLVLLIFVVLPMMNEPAPPMTQDEIVAEVLGSGDSQGADSGKEAEGVMPVPSPLVAIRNDGREVAVIFPATESETEEPPPAEKESAVQQSGLPQILSEQDVAEARAALQGEGSETAAPVEPRPAKDSEQEADVAIMVEEPVKTAAAQDLVAALISPPASEAPLSRSAEAEETQTDAGRENEETLNVAPGPDAAAAEEELEAMVRAIVRALALETEGTDGGDRRPGNALRLADRRGEFDMPVWLDSRPEREVSHPSWGVPESSAAEAAQAGDPDPGLPPRMGVTVSGTLRGVMGYRLPLISRQQVPDQIVSGVLIPAHTTFVILKEGSWELVDVTPEKLQVLVDAKARRSAPAAEVEPARSGWNPLRIFRKRDAPIEDGK